MNDDEWACILFPREFTENLKKLSQIIFNQQITESDLNDLPSVSNPFVTVDEIVNKTKSAKFIGFGHSILNGQDILNTEDLIYLFFQKESEYMEFVCATSWISNKIKRFYCYKTNCLEDLSIGEVDVFSPYISEKNPTFLKDQIRNISIKPLFSEILISFQDNTYTTFYYDMSIPTSSQIYFHGYFDPSVSEHLVLDVCFASHKDLANIVKYTFDESVRFFSLSNCCIDLQELLTKHQDDYDNVFLIVSKNKSCQIGKITWKISDSEEFQPFELCYYETESHDQESMNNRLILFQLVKLNDHNEWKIRTTFHSGNGKTVEDFLKNYLTKWDS